MGRLIGIFFIFLIFTFSYGEEFVVKKESIYPPEKTVKKIVNLLEKEGFKIFTIINHKKAAEKVGMNMNFSSVIVFGKPEVGTKLMKKNPTVALELPLKILVYKHKGRTYIAYKSPFFIEKIYKLNSFHRLFIKLNKKLEKITEKISY